MSQNKKPKGLLIVLITEIVLIVIGAVALIIVLISRSKSNTADNPSVQEEEEIAQEPAEVLTQEALAALSTEEGAKKSFEYVLKDYLDYTVENGTLEQDLLNHGWRKSKSGKVSEPTPTSLLRRSQLRKVLGKREFSKYSIPVLL